MLVCFIWCRIYNIKIKIQEAGNYVTHFPLRLPVTTKEHRLKSWETLEIPLMVVQVSVKVVGQPAAIAPSAAFVWLTRFDGATSQGISTYLIIAVKAFKLNFLRCWIIYIAILLTRASSKMNSWDFLSFHLYGLGNVWVISDMTVTNSKTDLADIQWGQFINVIQYYHQTIWCMTKYNSTIHLIR